MWSSLILTVAAGLAGVATVLVQPIAATATATSRDGQRDAITSSLDHPKEMYIGRNNKLLLPREYSPTVLYATNNDNSVAPTAAPNNNSNNGTTAAPTPTLAPNHSNQTTVAPSIAPTNHTIAPATPTTPSPTTIHTPSPTPTTPNNATTPSPTTPPSNTTTPAPSTVAPHSAAPVDHPTLAPVEPPTTPPAPAPSPSPPPPPDPTKFSLLRFVEKTLALCILFVLALLAFGAIMQNRYRIYFFLRGVWYTILRMSCTHWILVKLRIRSDSTSIDSSLNAALFENDDMMDQGLLMRENE
jgi:hypothetical protein